MATIIGYILCAGYYDRSSIRKTEISALVELVFCPNTLDLLDLVLVTGSWGLRLDGVDSHWVSAGELLMGSEGARVARAAVLPIRMIRSSMG